MVFGNGHLYLSDDLELSRADNFRVQNTPRAMSVLLQLARICQEPLDPRLHCFRKPAGKHFHNRRCISITTDAGMKLELP